MCSEDTYVVYMETFTDGETGSTMPLNWYWGNIIRPLKIAFVEGAVRNRWGRDWERRPVATVHGVYSVCLALSLHYHSGR